MFRTCEIRWFFPAPPFERLLVVPDDAASAPARVDWYASPPNPKSGIKFRDGRLEPKLLLHEHGACSVGPARGRIEFWGKWSLDFPHRDFPPDDLLVATNWIPVEKRRFLRSFRCDGRNVTEVMFHDDAHGQFEWTELRVRGAPWWTIGFEAFGGEHLEQVLLSIMGHVLGGLAGASSLGEKNSYSYPAWLHGLSEAGR